MLKAFFWVVAFLLALILAPMLLWTWLGLKGTMWGSIFGAFILIGLVTGGFLMWHVLMRAFFQDK